MNNTFLKTILVSLIYFLLNIFNTTASAQEFQGKAYYLSKSNMNLGKWGAKLSELQKKQIKARLKNRLEKSYILEFNKEESIYKEESKLDAISGATDSWGKNFAPGDIYKNLKTKTQTQNQEFYGKNFLVNDSLLALNWNLGSDTKKIGNYTCYKATSSVPTDVLTWYSFSWDSLRKKTDSTSSGESQIKMTTIEAWYTPQLPIGNGPADYVGLPGMILEVSAGDTTLLCYKIVLNPEEKIEIKVPSKGKVVTKTVYKETITEKMKEFRNNRMGRR
jgi:GLPGLI family protein